MRKERLDLVAKKAPESVMGFFELLRSQGCGYPERPAKKCYVRSQETMSEETARVAYLRFRAGR